MDSYTIILFLLIFLGGLIGFYKSKSITPPVLKLFPYFLMMQFSYQLIASLYSFVFTNFKSNYPIFNIFYLINFVFFSFLFSQIISAKWKRIFIAITAIIWVVFYFINLFHIQGISLLMTYSRTMLGILVVTYSLLYFHEILTDDKNQKNPLRDATFWVVTALFFFYLCSTLTISLWNYLVINKAYFGNVLMKIYAFILYSMYIAGFLLHKNYLRLEKPL